MCNRTPRIVALSCLFGALLAGSAFALSSANSVADFPQTEFVANLSSSIPEWSPLKAYNADEAQVLSAIYEGLFVYDPYNMNPVPGLAESWTLSKDSLTWTFKLRGGAVFADGTPITSAIIRDSWVALLDPKLNAPYASLLDPIQGVGDYRSGKTTNPATLGLDASDPTTLVVKLVAPAAHLPKILCHHAFSAIHPADIAAAAKANRPADYKPIASGAFSVESVSAEGIRLVKNPRYWDAARVYLPSIYLDLNANADALTARFNRGEINWLGGASTINKVSDSASVHVTPMFATEYFFFRTTWGPWADSRVRNALLLAVPWADLRSNYLIPATTLVFPLADYPQLDGITTLNVAEAKAALAKAGIADPTALEPLVISIPESAAFQGLVDILKKAWTDIGLRVEVRTTPFAQYYPSLRTDDYALGVTSWIGDFADPLSFLEIFRPTSSLNDSGWISDDYEKLIDESATCKLAKDRYAKLAEAEKVLLADAVILPVAHNPSLNVIDTNGISGWYDNALNIHPFKFIRFSPRRALPGVARTR